MRRAVVHVIGAGVAGLVAARALAIGGDRDVVVHEARGQTGGRRRAFRDETLGLEIDIGNFPLLSGWKATLALVDAIGARGEWVEDPAPGVAFADFAAGKRWRLAPNAGRAPWWLLYARHRGPDLTPADYWAMRRLLTAPADATVAAFAPSGPAFERLWRPLALAALNCEPDHDAVMQRTEIHSYRSRGLVSVGLIGSPQLGVALREAARPLLALPGQGVPAI